MQVTVAKAPKIDPFVPLFIKYTPPLSNDNGQIFSTHNPPMHICSLFTYPGQSSCELQNREHLGSGIPDCIPSLASAVTQIEVPFSLIKFIHFHVIFESIKSIISNVIISIFVGYKVYFVT